MERFALTAESVQSKLLAAAANRRAGTFVDSQLQPLAAGDFSCTDAASAECDRKATDILLALAAGSSHWQLEVRYKSAGLSRPVADSDSTVTVDRNKTDVIIVDRSKTEVVLLVWPDPTIAPTIASTVKSTDGRETVLGVDLDVYLLELTKQMQRLCEENPFEQHGPDGNDGASAGVFLPVALELPFASYHRSVSEVMDEGWQIGLGVTMLTALSYMTALFMRHPLFVESGSGERTEVRYRFEEFSCVSVPLLLLGLCAATNMVMLCVVGWDEKFMLGSPGVLQFDSGSLQTPLYSGDHYSDLAHWDHLQPCLNEWSIKQLRPPCAETFSMDIKSTTPVLAIAAWYGFGADAATQLQSKPASIAGGEGVGIEEVGIETVEEVGIAPKETVSIPKETPPEALLLWTPRLLQFCVLFAADALVTLLSMCTSAAGLGMLLGREPSLASGWHVDYFVRVHKPYENPWRNYQQHCIHVMLMFGPWMLQQSIACCLMGVDWLRVRHLRIRSSRCPPADSARVGTAANTFVGEDSSVHRSGSAAVQSLQHKRSLGMLEGRMLRAFAWVEFFHMGQLLG
jgi:hypothetical protein